MLFSVRSRIQLFIVLIIGGLSHCDGRDRPPAERLGLHHQPEGR